MEIKNCPFCGSKAKIIRFNEQEGVVTIGCTNEECDITMGKGFFSEEDAIAHWNRRINNASNEVDEVMWFFADETGKVIAKTLTGINKEELAIDRLTVQAPKGRYTLGYFKKDGTQNVTGRQIV